MQRLDAATPLQEIPEEQQEVVHQWDSVVFVELDDKDWVEMTKKEDTGLKIEEDPIKNIKNHYQNSKNATKDTKIGILQMIEEKDRENGGYGRRLQAH